MLKIYCANFHNIITRVIFTAKQKYHHSRNCTKLSKEKLECSKGFATFSLLQHHNQCCGSGRERFLFLEIVDFLFLGEQRSCDGQGWAHSAPLGVAMSPKRREHAAHGRARAAKTHQYSRIYYTVLRIQIRIHRIHMFLGLPDPDPLVRGMDPNPDPDPSIIMQKQEEKP